MFGFFKNKRNGQEEEAKFFKAFFKGIINEDRKKHNLEPVDGDFKLIFDFVFNEVLIASSGIWDANIRENASKLELVILGYHITHLMSVTCLKTGINRREREQFYTHAITKVVPLMFKNNPNLIADEYDREVELLILRANKIYGQEKVWETFESTFYKCLSDLESGSKEATGRRSLALMMTQLKERLAAYDLH